jgi:hypothetical protein
VPGCQDGRRTFELERDVEASGDVHRRAQREDAQRGVAADELERNRADGSVSSCGDDRRNPCRKRRLDPPRGVLLGGALVQLGFDAMRPERGLDLGPALGNLIVCRLAATGAGVPDHERGAGGPGRVGGVRFRGRRRLVRGELGHRSRTRWRRLRGVVSRYSSTSAKR